MESTGRPLGTERSPAAPFQALTGQERGAAADGSFGERIDQGRRESAALERHRRRRAQEGARSEDRRSERADEERVERRRQDGDAARERALERRAGEAREGASHEAPRADTNEPAAQAPAELATPFQRAPEPAPEATSAATPSDGSSAPGGGAAPITPGAAAPGTAPAADARGVLAVAGARGAAAAGGSEAASPTSARLGAGDAKAGPGAPTEPRTRAKAAQQEPARWAETPEAERAAQVLRQFRLQLHPGLRSATLQLAPAELGRLSIRVSVRDGAVRAVVRAERQETLDVLERHLPELRAALEQNGLPAQELDLGLASGEGGGRETTAGEDAPSRAQAPAGHNERDVVLEGASAQLADALARRSGIDTYA